MLSNSSSGSHTVVGKLSRSTLHLKEKTSQSTLPHGDSLEQLSAHLSTPIVSQTVSLRSIGVVFASCLAYYSNQYSISLVAVHLYRIGDVMDDYEEVIWFINAATLVVMLLGPAVAYYATVRTRKWILLGGLLFGVAGQLTSGLARVMHILVAGQALVGITLATQPLMVSIPGEILPQEKRRYAQIATNIAGGLGGLSGAIVGGAIFSERLPIPDKFGWEWAFKIGAILYGTTFILLALTYSHSSQVQSNSRQIKYPFDWAGSILLACGVVPLITGLTFGGIPSPWDALGNILPIAAGGVCLILFVIWELWGTSTGLFHHRMFTRGRNFPLALALFFIEGIIFIVFLVWYNQEVYELYERDSFFQGLRFSVFYGAVTVLAPFVSIFCARTKTVKPALLIGNIFIMAAAALMAASNRDSGRAVIAFAALAGVGMTAPLVTLMSTIHLCAPPDLIQAVAPLATMMRTFGIVSGNVIADVIVNTQFTALLPARLEVALAPFALSNGSMNALTTALLTRISEQLEAVGTTEMFSVNVLEVAQDTARGVQLDAFRVVWISVATLALFAIICCLSMAPVTPPEVPTPVGEGASPAALNTRQYNLETLQETREQVFDMNVAERHMYQEPQLKHKYG